MTRLASDPTPAKQPVPARPRRGSGLAQAGFLGWTDRVGALITMATSLGALAFAAGQLSHLNVMWLSIIGGALAGTSALSTPSIGMPRAVGGCGSSTRTP